MRLPKTHPRLQSATQLVLALMSLGSLTMAHAALTDISQTPLLTASGTPVKPNLLFALDDSGSMDLDYLPEAGNFAYTQYGSHTARCNGLAYKPGSAYSPPVDHLGVEKAGGDIDTVMRADLWLSDVASTDNNNVNQINTGNLTLDVNGSRSYPVGTPMTVYDNGNKKRWMIGIVTAWNSNTRKVTLSIQDYSAAGTMGTPYVGKGWPQFVHFTKSGGSTVPDLAYTYDGVGKVENGTAFYKECVSVIGAGTGATVFKHAVVREGTAEAQTLANWWAYYGTRMKMMKTVVSQAFKNIDDKFRVGYMTIHATSAAEGTSKKFLHIRDFTPDQKEKFYAHLEAAPTSGSTPLRGALSLAGRYYANKARNQGTVDPVQYSCQKNYTILASDGQWNTGDEDADLSFGPYDLAGKSVGQRDSAVDKPYRDASQGGGSGGSSNSLADIAMYYYATDLRHTDLGNCIGAALPGDTKGIDVCANNVEPAGRDEAVWQHMNTFTMSLGQNGMLTYDSNYEKQTSGSFYNLKQGSQQWPNPVLNSSTDPGKIDDLWHAAVNGRGLFFNASDAAAVTQSLKSALTEIDKDTATGSAAATSTLRPVEGDNQVFIASYTSGSWVGDLKAYAMNIDTAAIVTKDADGKDAPQWSAAAQLLARQTERNIYYGKGTALKAFTYSNLAADGHQANFDNACAKLSHCAALSAGDKTLASSGSNLVSYLRGKELSYYRGRTQVLGDIVGSSPVFAGTSPLAYKDSGYAKHVMDSKNRQKAVFVGSNDGMLHAFDAATGVELWAFVPTSVFPNLHKLADPNYESSHQYFVDGSPIVADVKIGSEWKTILVSGLGAGGKAYFALDITNANAPKMLWEFTNANLGLSFAPPVVVQKTNGDWVVVLSSGYNNVGDGQGRLFMLDAASGTLLAQVSTNEGNAATPAGLGPINAWVESSDSEIAKRFYAGDTLGNVWRFDPEGLLGFPNKAVKLATLVREGKTQSVTTKPVLAEVNYKGFKTPVVFIGTGRMLGLSDVQNTEPQTIYGIKDQLGATGWGDVRGSGGLVKQTLSSFSSKDGAGNTVVNDSVRTATNNPVDWSLKTGWYVDLPDSGERINVDMMLRYNTLVAGSNVPQSVASCAKTGHGYAWLYYLDIASGSNVGTSAGIKLASSMVVGLGAYELANGKGGVVATYSKGDPKPVDTPKLRSYLKAAKKSAWRELLDR